jgi:transposase
MSKRVYLGMDLGSTVCEAVARDEAGKIIGSLKFPPGERELRRAAAHFKGEVQVLLEEGELAHWAAGCIRGLVQEVIVCDPKRNAWIFKDSRKDDRVDAGKLAEILRLGQYRAVYQSEDEDLVAFKKLVTWYEELNEKQKRLKVQIKARLRREGVIEKSPTAPFTAEGRRGCLARVENRYSREAIAGMYELLDGILEAREKARRSMFAFGGRYPVVRMLREVPGVGGILACRFVAYVQDPHRFRSKRQLWRYARLGITDRRSDGKPLGRRRLDRSGVGPLKDLSRKAFDAARRCKEENLFQRTYRASLTRTEDPVHARLNTQRKILSVLLSMWRNGTEYEDENQGLKDGREAARN